LNKTFFFIDSNTNKENNTNDTTIDNNNKSKNKEDDLNNFLSSFINNYDKDPLSIFNYDDISTNNTDYINITNNASDTKNSTIIENQLNNENEKLNIEKIPKKDFCEMNCNFLDLLNIEDLSISTSLNDTDNIDIVELKDSFKKYNEDNNENKQNKNKIDDPLLNTSHDVNNLNKKNVITYLSNINQFLENKNNLSFLDSTKIYKRYYILLHYNIYLNIY